MKEEAGHWKGDGKDVHRKRLGEGGREQERCHGEPAWWKVKDRECEVLWWPLWLMVSQYGSCVAFKESFIYLSKRDVAGVVLIMHVIIISLEHYEQQPSAFSAPTG